ncbi:MAG: Potassium channel [Pycnora praestabilis]|nr:MAG: Potassium channel [Pycnora praestabilis]
MNDPGLDGAINENSKSIEKSYEQEEEEEEEEERNYLDPSRWWFASTAAPLTAGTFGPMASAFSICALVENWRVEIPPEATEEHGIDIRDPRWLIGINAVSLVLALIANLALLLNMAQRISFSIAQPITIIGWYIASILLIALLAVASSQLRLPSPPEHALTQAFYYGIFAAILYFLVATMMVATVYGAYKGHYDREFKLTMAQRTLMLQTISFLVYLLGGAAVYAHIEGWKFTDAVYWADFTLLTVGIGDYSPMTHLGRGLLFPYAFGGIVILGLVIGSIRTLVLERGKDKMGARMVEKIRESVVKRMDEENGKVRLKPFENNDLKKPNLSERKRRKQEFNLMRDIQDRATRTRRWTSLLISGGAWFFLWFIGAIVFWQAEKNQEWSYFQALYFAYTSLLTIGYGDFRPMSNSGKPFFVFWSLLAVPTLTILISNMGDTIVKGIKDLTLKIGEFTILPGDVGTREGIKRALARSSNGKFFAANPINQQTSGAGSEEAGKAGEPGHQKDLKGTNKLADELEHEELDEAQQAKDRGDTIGEDVHYYHFLLVKEIRKVMKHLNESPPRKYEYEEWAWYLKLIGEDEASARFHRAPPAKVEKKKDGEGPDMHQAQGLEDDQDIAKQWSWVGNRSPLMGDMQEAEWVLERLSMTLERELKKQRKEQRQEGQDRLKARPDSSQSSKTIDLGRESRGGIKQD